VISRHHTLVGAALGCRKWGIPSQGFGNSPFWGVLRQTKLDTRFKMYANGCYWVASGWADWSISPIQGKNTSLILPYIRVLVRKDAWRWHDMPSGNSKMWRGMRGIKGDDK